MFVKDQENNSCPWAGTSLCPVESCNTGIKLTKSLILKLILKLQLRSIDIKFGQSPGGTEPEQLHHVSQSMFGSEIKEGEILFYSLSVRTLGNLTVI